ncbi:MAG TPA: selenide, water dikinase [Nitrososphaerales archaeon]|nr:selenide, water dikinase [Nitrososphaerales archaeon]
MSTKQEFWDNVSKYREMGMDPLRWVAGCAVKVDLNTVVYPSLHNLKPSLKQMGISLGERVDADIFPLTENGPVITRRIYNPSNPEIDLDDLKKINPKRAISLLQVFQKNAEKQEKFQALLNTLYSSISKSDVHFTVGKGHSIITGFPEAEFALFDFISYEEGRSDGWCLSNNDTIQIIDPTADPSSEQQTNVAISNSLNDLISLGCFEELKVLPVVDAPNEEIKNNISKNMETFANKYNIELLTSESPQRGKLLIGATMFGTLRKEPPTKLNLLNTGMQILVTRPFGDLAPINVFLSCVADETFLQDLEKTGYTLKDVENAKNSVISTMNEPNLKVAEIINKYLPEFGNSFDINEHVLVTGDLSGPGIMIFKEHADNAQVDISLDNLPLRYPEFVKYATENFLMDNATAGTNGAVAVIASPNIIVNISSDLKSAGYDPHIIGTVLGKGNGTVNISKDVNDMITSDILLNQLNIGVE